MLHGMKNSTVFLRERLPDFSEPLLRLRDLEPDLLPDFDRSVKFQLK